MTNMTKKTTAPAQSEYPYFAIVTFGSPSYGTARTYYRSLASAIGHAETLGGGSLTNVRVVGARSRKQALDADISGGLPVLWSRS